MVKTREEAIQSIPKTLDELDTKAGEIGGTLDGWVITIAAGLLALPAFVEGKALDITAWRWFLLARVFLALTLLLGIAGNTVRMKAYGRGFGFLDAFQKNPVDLLGPDLRAKGRNTLRMLDAATWMRNGMLVSFLLGMLLVSILGAVETYPSPPIPSSGPVGTTR